MIATGKLAREYATRHDGDRPTYCGSCPTGTGCESCGGTGWARDTPAPDVTLAERIDASPVGWIALGVVACGMLCVVLS